jgi:protein tyrosine phosphatase domain-containing protein 1
MKRCCYHINKQNKKTKIEKDIENLNASSSKLKINNCYSLISKNNKNFNDIHNQNFNCSENLDKNSYESPLNKKHNSINQEKSLHSSNNISRSRSVHARVSKGNIDKLNDQNKNSICRCIKDKFICFFCGGKNCKDENFLKNENKPNAIHGLNSNFITENIIAGQRLSDVLIKKFNLIEKFKKLNIGLIINLQREGEHPFCGPNKLNNFGYSYNPSYFTSDDINVKFFGWKETKTSLSINFILEIIKTMCNTIINNKEVIYIHSHSGNGRTAVIIACYLLYTTNKSVDCVVKEIISKRKESFKNKGDIKNIQVFKDFLDDSRIIFGKKEKIDVYLKRQEDLLFGYEANLYGFIPKIITRNLEEIIRIKLRYKIDNVSIIKIIKGVYMEWNNDLENILFLIKKFLNRNDWTLFDSNENLILFVELLFDFCEDSTFFIINPEKTEQLISQDLFNKFFEKNNFFLTKQQKMNFLNLIKKIYYGYEFSILFQIAFFCGNLYEKTTNEYFNKEFEGMIQRLSLEFQGYNLTQINNLQYSLEYEKIEKRVKAVSKVINFILLEILEQKNYIKNKEKNDDLWNLLQLKSISSFLSSCIKQKTESKNISNIESNNPSLGNAKLSTMYFTRDESEIPASEKDLFSPLNMIDNNDNQNKREFTSDKKTQSKKTLITLLNKNIISKEQSNLLSFKQIKNHLFYSGNLSEKKFLGSDYIHTQHRKRSSFFVKRNEIINE